jgi:predicted alpha/beta superfamily hydrolase
MPVVTGTSAKSSEISISLAGGELRLHDLRSRIFRNSRKIRVWLPPQYGDLPGQHYPVFYLNDGQNLFEASTAFAGVDWHVADTAARLIAEQKIPPLIIVGIDNTGKNRLREYIPYRSIDPRVLWPLGRRYPDFLLKEVKPLIENQYQVATGPDNRGLGGSSLGGLITLYTQLAEPGVFGMTLIESPSLFVAKRRILAECRNFKSWPFRVYLGMGTREIGVPARDEIIVNDVRDLAGILSAAGLDEHRLKVTVEEGATHGEKAWGERFPAALEFLFGAGSGH